MGAAAVHGGPPPPPGSGAGTGPGGHGVNSGDLDRSASRRRKRDDDDDIDKETAEDVQGSAKRIRPTQNPGSRSNIPRLPGEDERAYKARVAGTRRVLGVPPKYKRSTQQKGETKEEFKARVARNREQDKISQRAKCDPKDPLYDPSYHASMKDRAHRYRMTARWQLKTKKTACEPCKQYATRCNSTACCNECKKRGMDKAACRRMLYGPNAVKFPPPEGFAGYFPEGNYGWTYMGDDVDARGSGGHEDEDEDTDDDDEKEDQETPAGHAAGNQRAEAAESGLLEDAPQFLDASVLRDILLATEIENVHSEHDFCRELILPDGYRCYSQPTARCMHKSHMPDDPHPICQNCYDAQGTDAVLIIEEDHALLTARAYICGYCVTQGMRSIRPNLGQDCRCVRKLKNSALCRQHRTKAGDAILKFALEMKGRKVHGDPRGLLPCPGYCNGIGEAPTASDMWKCLACDDFCAVPRES